MDKLKNLAKVLRSKNSGPFSITLDVLFEDEESYERTLASGYFTRDNIAALYKLRIDEITELVFFHKALGIKVTFNRNVSSGTAFDRDVYGAQQHAPLLDLIIP
ncbi:DUF4387 domain-containing protein [Alloiococcus sp. CFN-8]|uniref:DUF4387 domain-containing protein n=1 Tax=Alloiococcus sp. CFN-8 TaxID=3416081 RepID=UPI003CEFD7BD